MAPYIDAARQSARSLIHRKVVDGNTYGSVYDCLNALTLIILLVPSDTSKWHKFLFAVCARRCPSQCEKLGKHIPTNEKCSFGNEAARLLLYKTVVDEWWLFSIQGKLDCPHRKSEIHKSIKHMPFCRLFCSRMKFPSKCVSIVAKNGLRILHHT